MKVLLLSLFHPELVRGGAQQLCYELFEGLGEADGVEPVLMAAVDPSFAFLYKSGARITGFDGRPNEYIFLSRDYDYRWHKTRSAALLESFIEFLNDVAPDVVHFHHFLLFGVDLITLVRRILPKAKIVFTLHEFIAICAADGQMVRTTDRSLCSGASSVRCHQCFPDRGPDHFFLREQWIKRHLAQVDVFTTPSRFMIDVYANWGLEREKLVHVANAQKGPTAPGLIAMDRPQRNRFGFFGQLVDNKGVHVLLEAVNFLRSQGFTDFHVEINGDNLRYASAQRSRDFEAFLAAEADRPADRRNVVFNGSYQVDQLGPRMARVDWCVVPSVWHEAFALVISEAWMYGRPVICSNIGAMAERVRSDIDGLHFDAGDSKGLAEAMRRASSEAGLWSALAAGIAPPEPRETMVEQYLALYRGAGSKSGTITAGSP